MQHLESERIAAFDHDAPTAGELAHLEACARCRTERAEFSALSKRALLLIDAPVAQNMPRLTNWESLSSRLRSEGLIGADASAAPSQSEIGAASVPPSTERVVAIDSRRAAAPVRVRNDWWRMAAAAVMLVAGGVVYGRYSSAAGPDTNAAESSASATTAGFDFGLGPRAFGSVEEASKALARTERDFNRISLWITANDPSANAPDVLRRRLAQLTQVVATSQAAWQAAPQDKVLEHYYKSAYAARELTIQQLGSALPVGRALERF